MNKAVLFALAVVCVGAFNDLIYNKNGIYNDKKGVFRFYLYASAFSALYCFIYIIIAYGKIELITNEIIYGVILGIVSFATYLLFLLSFDGINTSVSITIFRMNLVPGIILAMIFLGESLTLKRMAGITLCLLGMLMFANRKKESTLGRKYLLLSVCACLCCGVLNVLNKSVSQSGMNVFNIMLFRFTVVSLITTIILIFTKSKKGISHNVGYSMLSGLLLMLSVLFTMQALKTGDITVVIPITQMSFIVTTIVSCLLYKETISKMKIFGIACCILSVVMIQ